MWVDDMVWNAFDENGAVEDEENLENCSSREVIYCTVLMLAPSSH